MSLRFKLVLIVPYGIEILTYMFQILLTQGFNRTLWN